MTDSVWGSSPTTAQTVGNCMADSEHNDILQEDNTVLNKMLSISTD